MRDLCRQKGLELLEGHAMADHIHLCLSIPPKYSVAHSIGFLKDKSAVRIHRAMGNKKSNRAEFLVNRVLCKYSRIG